MALAFRRRLAVPLWAIALLTVAFTAPSPATLVVIAAAGIAMVVFSRRRGMLRGPAPRSPVFVHSPPRPDHGSAGTTVAAGFRVTTLDEPARRTADDALDLVRMDDDGGWHLARPPASPDRRVTNRDRPRTRALEGDQDPAWLRDPLAEPEDGPP